MARYLEEKDIWDKEKEESRSPGEPEVVLPSPPPAQTKDKKSVDKGRIVTVNATGQLNVCYQYHNFSSSKMLHQHTINLNKLVCFSQKRYP